LVAASPAAELSTQVADHGNERTYAHSAQHTEPNVRINRPESAEADQRPVAFAPRHPQGIGDRQEPNAIQRPSPRDASEKEYKMARLPN
jgi:hypothetical protein